MNCQRRFYLAHVHHRRHVVAILIGIAILLAFQRSPASAQTGGGYDLTWSTIDNGGAASNSANGYVLAGSIGQPDAGAASQVSANGYVLSGGFMVLAQYRAYVPIAIRN
jgi:hypothetical protein